MLIMKMKKFRLLFLLPALLVTVGTASILDSQNVSGVVEVAASDSSEMEDFMDEWGFAIDTYTNVCDIPKAEFDKILGFYRNLSTNEKESLSTRKYKESDDFTIAQAIDTLLKMYYPTKQESNENREKLTQSTAIIIVVVVSIFGMSAISVLYILKNNKLIE